MDPYRSSRQRRHREQVPRSVVETTAGGELVVSPSTATPSGLPIPLQYFCVRTVTAASYHPPMEMALAPGPSFPYRCITTPSPPDGAPLTQTLRQSPPYSDLRRSVIVVPLAAHESIRRPVERVGRPAGRSVGRSVGRSRVVRGRQSTSERRLDGPRTADRGPLRGTPTN